MSRFPGSPRVVPGAIVALDLLPPRVRAISFQYNPDEVTRTITPRRPPASGGPASDAHRIWGAPTESISLTLELDATDGLETGDAATQEMGVAGRIAVLETLLYPASATVIANAALTAIGTIEVLPPTGPLIVLSWSTERVVPVAVDGLTVREQAYDATLTPIRASIEVTLTVLSYDDLSPLDPAYAMFLTHQSVLETQAARAVAAGASGSQNPGGQNPGGQNPTGF